MPSITGSLRLWKTHTGFTWDLEPKGIFREEGECCEALPDYQRWSHKPVSWNTSAHDILSIYCIGASGRDVNLGLSPYLLWSSSSSQACGNVTIRNESGWSDSTARSFRGCWSSRWNQTHFCHSWLQDVESWNFSVHNTVAAFHFWRSHTCSDSYLHRQTMA